MPRGYLCILVAACAWTSVAASLPPRQGADTKQTEPAKPVAQSLESIAATLQEKAKPSVTDQPCRDGEENRNSDLCAQWKAADAGRDSSNAAWFFGVLGCLIGGATLIAAVKAAQYAKEAATHTKAGADAALAAVAETQEANRISREAAALQLRPYVFIVGDEKFDPEPLERGKKIHFAFKNYGNGPASNVRIQINSEVIPRPIGGFEVILSPTRGTYGTIAPGALIKDHMRCDLSVAEMAAIAAGQALLARIRLTYELPSGASDFHDVTFVLAPDGMQTSTFNLLSDDERQRS